LASISNSSGNGLFQEPGFLKRISLGGFNGVIGGRQERLTGDLIGGNWTKGN